MARQTNIIRHFNKIKDFMILVAPFWPLLRNFLAYFAIIVNRSPSIKSGNGSCKPFYLQASSSMVLAFMVSIFVTGIRSCDGTLNNNYWWTASSTIAKKTIPSRQKNCMNRCCPILCRKKYEGQSGLQTRNLRLKSCRSSTLCWAKRNGAIFAAPLHTYWTAMFYEADKNAIHDGFSILMPFYLRLFPLIMSHPTPLDLSELHQATAAWMLFFG